MDTLGRDRTLLSASLATATSTALGCHRATTLLCSLASAALASLHPLQARTQSPLLQLPFRIAPLRTVGTATWRNQVATKESGSGL